MKCIEDERNVGRGLWFVNTAYITVQFTSLLHVSAITTPSSGIVTCFK